MKKLIIVLLSLIIIVVLFVGCLGAKKTPSKENKTGVLPNKNSEASTKNNDQNI